MNGYNRSNIAVVKKEGSDISLKYVTTLLNSSLLSWYFTKKTAKAERKLFPKIILNDLRLFPIKNISLKRQKPFIDLADKMLALNADLQLLKKRFLKRLTDNFDGVKITGMLERFETLDFKQLLAELRKQKIAVPPKQQAEWDDFFTESTGQVQAMLANIRQTDTQIDNMVYDLYGLTDEEIGIVNRE